MIESDLDKRKKKQKRLRIYYIILAMMMVMELAIGGYAYYEYVYLPNKPVELALSDVIPLTKADVFSNLQFGGTMATFTVGQGIKNLETKDINKKDMRLSENQTVVVNVQNFTLADLKAMGFILPSHFEEITDSGINWGAVAGQIIPITIVFVLIYLLFFSDILTGGFGHFKRDKSSICFADIGGLEEVKANLMEASRFIVDRKYFVNVGAKIPKGILLTGAPGVGKTMLARAMANEAGVAFHYSTGSEFHSHFVAMAAQRVRKLFKMARRSPSIVFIDEFDSLGQARNFRGTDMSSDNEHTLNQLLAEMDGFTKDTQVLVIAATNHPEVLDPALLRPGRFDRRIDVGLPTFKERIEILQIHAKGKPLATDVSLDNLAKQTGGMSGADLAGVMNEAAIRAGRAHKDNIGMADLINAIDAVVAGAERKALVMTDKEKRTTAFHEAGHTLVASLLPECEKVQRVSILPHGVAGGFTRFSNEQETTLLTKNKALAMIAAMLGGRAAEELIIGDITSGAQSDLQKANQVAKEMVERMGMGEHYGLRFNNQQGSSLFGYQMGGNEISDEARSAIEQDVVAILDSCYSKAKELVKGNGEKLEKLANRLIEVEVVDGDEVTRIIGSGNILTMPCQL